MPVKSYVTSMPDKTGAFMLASKIIAKHNGNITRVSYNKAVDLHTLFIDVEAGEEDLCDIGKELASIGYINDKISETRVIIVVIKIPDVPGAVLAVLKILDRYDINISYINSSSNNTRYQNFKMGLLVENPKVVKMLLDDISELYQIDIMDYEDSEKNLDNTIFYLRLANEMQKLMGLSTEKTMEFISESNRILQMLQEKGENPDKVFDYIRRFAHFISKHRGINFNADIEKLEIGSGITLYSIQPPCGSNTYIFDAGSELTLIDTGYAIYAGEMMKILQSLFPDWSSRSKKVYITHADKFEVIDSGTPEEHEELLQIGNFSAAGLDFEIFEGSGGHLYGEMVFVCRKFGTVFTGDILVNISGFSPERAEFNSLAPYRMTSVNVDSHKASEMRKQVIELIEDIGSRNKKPCIICGGHGPLSVPGGTELADTRGISSLRTAPDIQ